MSTALTVRQPQPDDWQMIQMISKAAMESGALGTLKPQAHAMKLLTAWENGLPLTSAFANVHIINNIPTLSPKAVWAKIVTHPDFKGYGEEKLEKGGKFYGYRITLERQNGVKATREFTLDDAKIARLDQKDNWTMYAANMCYWRAMGFAQDVVFPDVTMGVVRADTFAYVTAEGEVIDGSWSVDNTPKPETKVTKANTDYMTAVNELVHEFGAAKVYEIAGNKIPTSMEEVEALRVKLSTAQAETLDNMTIENVPEQSINE